MRTARARAVAVVIAAAVVPAAAADPAPAPVGRDACARGTRWRGHKIDFDVRDATVPDVVRLLAEIGRINVVVADDVAGKITLRLRGVPWDQVLCTVAATRRLSVERDDTVYLVRPR
jgi:type IV pilus assembly protein PilQ